MAFLCVLAILNRSTLSDKIQMIWINWRRNLHYLAIFKLFSNVPLTPRCSLYHFTRNTTQYIFLLCQQNNQLPLFMNLFRLRKDARLLDDALAVLASLCRNNLLIQGSVKSMVRLLAALLYTFTVTFSRIFTTHFHFR